MITALLSMSACELFDPTDVVNPNLTEDAILGTANPMISWIGGCERQLALISNAAVTIAEIASDNYQNTRTFYNQNLDKLNILFTDVDMNTLQFAMHRLREMADYGLNIVAPADPSTTQDQLAKLHVYKGLASLLSAEYFKALPGAPSGVLLSPAQHLQKAVDEFTTALTLATDQVTISTATLARARTHYWLGNAVDAINDAQAAITASPSFLLTVEFDATNAPTSTIQNALFDRGTFDDLQPLPRLDFLDPKSFFISASVESATPFLKIEEAHLIIAEAQLAQNNLAGAKTTLSNLLTVVASRPVVNLNDNVEGRTEAAPGSRPNNNAVQVAASALDPLRAGLVRNRNGAGVTVPVPTVSGTSVTDAMITALITEDEALELLYLMRQEIFIAEGRRMTDMGIRFVVSEVEALANSNIPAGDASTISSLPSFIEGIKTELDAFTYDANANTTIITHNVNKILMQNKAATTVLPFH